MPYNILLVDDDKEFRSEFKDCFEDYHIIEVSSGQEALQMLKKANEIDLVILDVMMPGLRGTEVLKAIKRIDPDLGIIILTGHGSKDVIVEALRGHADEYIEKPFHINKTKEIIEKVLELKNAKDTPYASGLNGKIERVKRFVQRNYHRKVCLKEAAQAVCLSPKYLSRIFKQKKNMRFSEYRLGIKIEKAKALLHDTGYNVDQISDKMGYQNAESFIRIFKKSTGLTPTQYRKRSKKGTKK